MFYAADWNSLVLLSIPTFDFYMTAETAINSPHSNTEDKIVLDSGIMSPLHHFITLN